MKRSPIEVFSEWADLDKDYGMEKNHKESVENMLSFATKQQKPFSFIPFGAGPRLCAGRNFAMMEMVLILAKTVQRFKIESDENYFVEMGPLMTLRPKDDIAIKLALR